MKRSFRITPEEMKNIIELLNEHRSIIKVISISGRSKRTLIEIAKKNNIKMKNSRMRLEEEEKIVVLLKEMKNAQQVAKIVGRGATTVLSVASNHGIRLTYQRKSKV